MSERMTEKLDEVAESKFPVGPNYKYALVSPAGEVARVDGNIDPTVQTKEGWRWLPYSETPIESRSDQKIVAQLVVLPDRVTMLRTAVDLTQEELVAREVARQDALLAAALNDPLAGAVRSLVENGKPMDEEDWRHWVNERL